MKNTIYKALTVLSLIVAIGSLLYAATTVKKAKSYKDKYEQAEANNEVLQNNQQTLEDAIEKYGQGRFIIVKNSLEN